MKKYKVYWSLWNLFSNTQAEVVKLQQIVSGIAAAVTSSTWYATDAKHALYVALGFAVLDKIIACIYLEEKK